MAHSAEEIRAELKVFLEGREEVLAAWEGGSAATGWLDEYSDLDLEMRPVFFGTRPDSIKSGMFIMRKGILLLLPFLRESAGNSFNP